MIYLKNLIALLMMKRMMISAMKTTLAMLQFVGQSEGLEGQAERKAVMLQRQTGWQRVEMAIQSHP